MSHKTLIRAIANAAPAKEADMVLGATLEIAIAEIDSLTQRLSSQDDQQSMLLACAVEGRLRALDRLVGECMAITWKEGREPEVTL
jgi:hypothetical protein